MPDPPKPETARTSKVVIPTSLRKPPPAVPAQPEIPPQRAQPASPARIQAQTKQVVQQLQDATDIGTKPGQILPGAQKIQLTPQQAQELRDFTQATDNLRQAEPVKLDPRQQQAREIAESIIEHLPESRQGQIDALFDDARTKQLVPLVEQELKRLSGPQFELERQARRTAHYMAGIYGPAREQELDRLESSDPQLYELVIKWLDVYEEPTKPQRHSPAGVSLPGVAPHPMDQWLINVLEALDKGDELTIPEIMAMAETGGMTRNLLDQCLAAGYAQRRTRGSQGVYWLTELGETKLRQLLGG